ncbi:unnamed protein product [Microthlaspi erraticum]|uniref:Uncharacterized protein n=1 Tax=Microthlaspi erraticum TaxID=1685480 RepID=A0A6D2LPD5_9BRAS|nr:unnamed protein product [Microthlaspi erraticum]
METILFVLSIGCVAVLLACFVAVYACCANRGGGGDGDESQKNLVDVEKVCVAALLACFVAVSACCANGCGDDNGDESKKNLVDVEKGEAVTQEQDVSKSRAANTYGTFLAIHRNQQVQVSHPHHHHHHRHHHHHVSR